MRMFLSKLQRTAEEEEMCVLLSASGCLVVARDLVERLVAYLPKFWL